MSGSTGSDRQTPVSYFLVASHTCSQRRQQDCEMFSINGNRSENLLDD